jgi:hypothetical protein
LIDSAPDRRFQLDKRRQLFIRAHNEMLSVAAMCALSRAASLLSKLKRLEEMRDSYFPI